MFLLISGANDSGKSAFAESLAARLPNRRVYLATMRPQTEENRIRIARHRRQRAALNFVTIEAPFSVGELDIQKTDTVLLEDVSNLLANVMFETEREAASVLPDILALAGRCRHLIAVTISGLTEENYHGETAEYIRALNDLNASLAQRADGVAEMTDGVPFARKGDWHGMV